MAHLKGLNNLLLTVDSGISAVLVFPDLTVAFDAVDNNILRPHLDQCVGTMGMAFE